MGRHHSNAYANTNPNADTKSHALANPRRQSRRFAIADRLPRRFTGADFCIPVAVAQRVAFREREPVTRAWLADRFALAWCEILALSSGVTFTHCIAVEERLSVARKRVRRVEAIFRDGHGQGAGWMR